MERKSITLMIGVLASEARLASVYERNVSSSGLGEHGRYRPAQLPTISDLNVWFKKAEKEALDAAIRALGVPATGLNVERCDRDAEFPPTSSHFGGMPYFESGDTWPTALDGSAYDFVCQINLKECPARPDVPYDLFTVFISFSTELFDKGHPDTCDVKPYREPDDKNAIAIRRPDSKENWTKPCRITTFEYTPPFSLLASGNLTSGDYSI